MIKKLSFALIILSLLLGACAGSSRNLQSEGRTDVVTEMMQVEAPAEAPMPATIGAGEKGAYALDQTAASTDRLVIKNGSLSMSVKDPLISRDNIARMVDAMGGFVVSADMYQQTLNNGVQVPQVSMTIRVPAERLDEALAAIKAETDQPIINENMNSQDVTAEYTDLNSRLINLQAAEKQLQGIMDDANRTEDVLAVYSQLVSVREQIELIKGQMKYYEQSAKLSSISIQLLADAAVQPITIAGWQPVGIAKEAILSLIHTLQSLAGFGIRFVIYYLPVLLVICLPFALIIWAIVSLVKRRKKTKKALPPEPQA
jgi:hypothetical protein